MVDGTIGLYSVTRGPIEEQNPVVYSNNDRYEDSPKDPPPH